MSSSRKDFYTIIEEQKAKICTYEAKISDLIKAYKSLSREKNALQLSLEAVSCPSLEQQLSDKSSLDGKNEKLEEKKYPSEEEEKCIVGENDSVAEVRRLRVKVNTLTDALKTLSAEKNLTESSLREDRKKILDDKKKLETQLKSTIDENVKLKGDFDSKLQDYKTRIIISQHERELESSNGAVMLREVESCLLKERNESVKLEKQLDEIKEQNRQFTLALGTKNLEKKQQKQICDLQNELEQVRCRLKKAELQCEEPPILKKLHSQMEEMKGHYMAAVFQEKLRAEAAEKSSKELSQLHEERVAALEARLTELSFTAANYDRTKQADLQTINVLREKIAELSEANLNWGFDNNSMSSSASIVNENIKNTKIYPQERESMEECDIKSLKEQFLVLWDQIQRRQNYEVNIGIEDLFSNSAIVHRKCKIAYDELQERCEMYKARNRNDSVNSSYCSCGLKEQLDEAHKRIRSMNQAQHTTLIHHNQQVSSSNEEIKNLHLRYSGQIKQLKHERKVAVNNLEQQLIEHCQRSLLTLQDRDEEIHRLIREVNKYNKEAKMQPSTVAAALLSQVNSGGSDGLLLHHFEEIARKDLEITELRKEKNSLEKSMREIQMNAIDKQQYMQDNIDELADHIERLRRNSSREGENLEYLKNVVLQYMTTYEVEKRLLILKAIAAILKFTAQEIESVKKCLSLWWWQTPHKNKSQEHNHARRPSVGGYGNFTSI